MAHDREIVVAHRHPQVLEKPDLSVSTGRPRVLVVDQKSRRRQQIDREPPIGPRIVGEALSAAVLIVSKMAG
jgi:Uma2 family endonuclease